MDRRLQGILVHLSRSDETILGLELKVRCLALFCVPRACSEPNTRAFNLMVGNMSVAKASAGKRPRRLSSQVFEKECIFFSFWSLTSSSDQRSESTTASYFAGLRPDSICIFNRKKKKKMLMYSGKVRRTLASLRSAAAATPPSLLTALPRVYRWLVGGLRDETALIFRARV